MNERGPQMLKTAVIGAGFMGQLHCKAYASLEGSNFLGIFDADRDRAEEVSAKYGVKSFSSSEELISAADAVSIAVPTVLHFGSCMECLAKDRHMLIEKPIAATIDQAREIAANIRQSPVVAAVGYIERFNPAVVEFLRLIQGRRVKLIEAMRAAPRVDRANDVSAVFDLMIHDIDIALAAVGASPKSVSAAGEKISSPVFNRASAEIVFQQGARAVLLTDKTAPEKVRKIKAVCDGLTVEADLLNKTVKHNLEGKFRSYPVEGPEPIKEEVSDFLDSVRGKKTPKVSAVDSLRSFELAWEIEEKLSSI